MGHPGLSLKLPPSHFPGRVKPVNSLLTVYLPRGDHPTMGDHNFVVKTSRGQFCVTIRPFMLRRTGHLWNRTRLWWYESDTSQRTADRPHWIAIVLGLLAPTLGIVALAVSYRSFRVSEQSLETSRLSVDTSQQSMKVAQRAYIEISNERAEIRPDHYRELSPLKLTGSDMLAYGFAITNLGNTPAEITEISIGYWLPGGWDLAGFAGRPKMPREDRFMPKERYLAPKQSIYWHQLANLISQYGSEGYDLSNYSKQHVAFVMLVGGLQYKDTFGDSHDLPLCWGSAD